MKQIALSTHHKISFMLKRMESSTKSRTFFHIIDSNFFSTFSFEKTLLLKKRKKSIQIPCIEAFIVLNYYGAVKKQLLALMQEVATRSVALPRNARRFSCGASLLS